MKMYYFNPNDYNVEFFVMAENIVDAHKFVLQHLEKELAKEKMNYPNINYISSTEQYLLDWQKVNPEDPTTFPYGYTIDEHAVGSVVQTELS